MFQRSLSIIGIFVVVGLLYLLFWPVPVAPVAWQPPENEGYVGKFAPNNALTDIQRINLGKFTGPEDVAIGPDDLVYFSTHEGSILRLDPATNQISQFANTKGRPLGIEFGADGNLYVADAYLGLLKVDPSGETSLLTDKVNNGSNILYADDLDVTSAGVVYFSDASTKFGAKANGGTLPASLLDLLEHGPNGRILKYDPATQTTTTIHQGMSFANGVALTSDERNLLVVETGSYAIHKIPLENPENSRVVVSNLPGFPDNINTNPDGTFWVGLASPRSPAVDMLSKHPFLRKVVQRLPAIARPKPQRYGFILKIDETGEILETLQDPTGEYALTTGAAQAGNGRLYISSLTEPDLAVLDRKSP